jgi:hypothetical protein
MITLGIEEEAVCSRIRVPFKSNIPTQMETLLTVAVTTSVEFDNNMLSTFEILIPKK